jgi:hypothetical protein
MKEEQNEWGFRLKDLKLKKMFNSTRCMKEEQNKWGFRLVGPNLKKKRFVVIDNTVLLPESEGSMPLHLTVFCRGRIFITKCLDENEVPLTPPELQQQFQYITDKCANEPEGQGLGALTGDNRTTWAQVKFNTRDCFEKNALVF